MKRWVKAWLAAGVGCCVCGAVLLGIGAASGGSKYVKEADLNRMEGSAKRSDNEAVLEKTKLEDFDSVDISHIRIYLHVPCTHHRFLANKTKISHICIHFKIIEITIFKEYIS